MRNFYSTLIAGSVALLGSPLAICAQAANKPDLGNDPTLYVVGYAHLDAEWRWNIRRSLINTFATRWRITSGYSSRRGQIAARIATQSVGAFHRE